MATKKSLSLFVIVALTEIMQIGVMKVVKIINPLAHPDERGCFFETFSAPFFKLHGMPFNFPQDNQVR